jgi:hypothetical protein
MDFAITKPCQLALVIKLGQEIDPAQIDPEKKKKKNHSLHCLPGEVSCLLSPLVIIHCFLFLSL